MGWHQGGTDGTVETIPEDGMKFPGVCPDCGGSGCDRCSCGTVEFSLPVGEPGYGLYVKICNRCGAEVGGCLTGNGLPEPEVSKYAVCPYCEENHNDIRLEKVE
jgi:DNA-directed RNA polymerase subunit RPC12/RpoP